MTAIDWVIRWIPGHIWVRPFVSWTGNTEPGHNWMYAGMVRRDAWRIGRVGFGVLRMRRRPLNGHERRATP